MCMGGNNGGGDSTAVANAQMAQQQALADQQLAEQQREFDLQQKQNDQTLANTQAQQAEQQRQIDEQAQLEKQWQTGRAQEASAAANTVNSAFAKFTPAYFDQYTKDYTAHYQPQIQDQSDKALNQTTFGLARSGNLQSQTAANQFQDRSKELGLALSDLNNSATAATTQQRANVENAKSNLMGTALSDATLGSPITPGSADAITANFNNTANALQRLNTQTGDTITTLSAVPQYASLGNLFAAAASGTGAAMAGNNAYSYGQGFSNALGAANPNGSGSGRVN